MCDLLQNENAQVSMEFILITGGVIVAALAIWGIQGAIRSFAKVTVDWVGEERNSTLEKITR